MRKFFGILVAGKVKIGLTSLILHFISLHLFYSFYSFHSLHSFHSLKRSTFHSEIIHFLHFIHLIHFFHCIFHVIAYHFITASFHWHSHSLRFISFIVITFHSKAFNSHRHDLTHCQLFKVEPRRGL